MDRTSVRVSWLSVVCVVATGCMGEISSSEQDVDHVDSPVINGTTDSGDPAVVMLRATQGGYCTGTLVAPSVVITAAHCVDGITAKTVGFGLNGQSTPAAVRAQIAHPRWNGNALEAGNDVAVLLLQYPVADVTPIPISTDVSEARAGDAVRIVGYGNNRTAGTGFGTKRQASLRVVAPNSDDGDISQDKFVKVWDASTGTQTCNGDSGGPVFFSAADGREHVVGVTSFGYQGCEGGAFHTRVAAYTDFLDDYVSIDVTPPPPPPPPPPGDSVAPTISLVSPANNSTITAGQRSIVFDASDNVAVKDVTLTWSYNGKIVKCSAPAAGWTCNVNGSRYTFSANIGTGVRRFSAKAVDAAGNVGQTAALSISLR